MTTKNTINKRVVMGQLSDPKRAMFLVLSPMLQDDGSILLATQNGQVMQRDEFNEFMAACIAFYEKTTPAEISAMNTEAAEMVKPPKLVISDKVKMRDRASSARSRIYKQLAARDGEKCRQCGSTHKLHVDHIKPISLGGTNDLTNLQLLCQSCNIKKSNKYTGE